MQQFQSLKRMLIFYSLTLLIMLVLYYAMMFVILRANTEQHSQTVFEALGHEFSEPSVITDHDIEAILARPIFQNISYQLILMLPSGQTYIYSHTRPHERKFTTISFPHIKSQTADTTSTYKLTSSNLMGMFNLKNGQRLYVVLRHQPLDVNVTSYQYWLPLMTAIMLFITALLYLLKRRDNWEQLLLYADNLTTSTPETYTPPPFNEAKSTLEFLRLGHTLSRISYQLHHKHRRIKTLSHRIERLVDHAPLPVLMIMRQGHISFFNQRFEQLFATVFQRDVTYMLTDFVTGSDKTTQQHLQKIDAQRVARTLLVYGLEDKQAYQLHINPWFGDHGQIHGFTVMLNNVNELVAQNAHLQQQQQQLNQQILELKQLKVVIGHELRTPLNAIIGTLDLIEPREVSAKQQEVLTTLTQSSYSMLAMLNDMLDMAKIEAGKLHLVHEPVDIFKLSQHVTDLMVGNARRQGIELLYFFMPTCPRYINTDTNRLRQILQNLLDNAVKFTPSGYVALIVEPISDERIQLIINDRRKGASSNWAATDAAVSADDQWLKNATRTPQTWLHFKIQDTGIGMSTAEQSQIFAYFNQANPQISEQFGGTGLGLAISSSFAQLLGGFIQLTSAKGSGSCFDLYLPMRQPTYQPIYHFHDSLKHVHLIAIVNHSVSASYLQRLCQQLSIRATIYSTFDTATVQQLTDQLAQPPQTHAPILLVDYEYYLANTERKTANKVMNEEVASVAALEHTLAKTTTDADIDIDTGIDSENSAENDALHTDFYDWIQSTRLPKILLSMKPERGISSALLDNFDGFLSKPLDVARLLSELMRLTQPTLKALAIDYAAESSKDINNKAVDNKHTEANKSTDQELVAESETTTRDNADYNASKPLILVVEDNLTNQKITCKLLNKLGYDSVVAENGLQALEMLQQQRQAFALILMDCRMPVMDGLQATQAIRTQGDNITIIALTANNSADDREACLAVGMDEFLTKPINKDQLQAVLQRFINR